MLAFFGLRAARPGTWMAVPHWPLISVRTNACGTDDGLKNRPPAAQAPPAHDTAFTLASVPKLARTAEFAVAGTTTNARTGANIAATTMRLLRICAPVGKALYS